MSLSILYRGPLSSCNYACDYCPFAKRSETPDELAHDRECLERFVTWAGTRRPNPPTPLPSEGRGSRRKPLSHPPLPSEGRGVGGLGGEGSERSLGILFTPWGEALVRKWYQAALAALTQMPHIRKAAIQTNLSCKLDWIEDCDKTKLALWCTFHPTETTRERFLAKCRELLERGVRFSVGVVGLKEHFAEIDALRCELPAEVYLWVNAFKREPDYYSPEMIAALTRVDPLFPLNNEYHASRGESCRAGSSVISVDGDGSVRRCHFIKTVIGNIYAADFESCLMERPCVNDTCGCHIGYVHLDRLKLYDTFGDGVLERVPLTTAHGSE